MSATPSMLPLDQAQGLIAERVHPLPAETVPLQEADGRVLALDVTCDMDYPPFHKAMMDGYAVCCADFAEGIARLEVLAEVVAGDAPQLTMKPGQAVPISTGAPVPDGADAVVPVECSALADHGRVVELRDDPQPGRYIAPRGQDLPAGAIVLTAGTQLGPPQIAALAAVGATAVSVHRRPSVAILVTGNELVPAEARPGAGQIRASNSYYLVAAVRQLGLEPQPLGIVADDRAALRSALESGLRADVLLTTGGISMGKYDLVADLLSELGVRVCFSKVAVKPGKPTWFGTHHDGKLVFALAGNPASCLVGWHLLAGPALLGLQGAPLRFPAQIPARSDQPLPAADQRQTFLPARVQATEAGPPTVRPVGWTGSGDLFGLVRANALIVRPAHSPAVPAGQPVSIVPLEPLHRL